MGFAKALELMGNSMAAEKERITHLRYLFIEKLKMIRLDIIVNGGEKEQKMFPNESVEEILSAPSPHILNISIPGIDNEFFVLQLDAKGIACSTKSSCLRDLDESYVLKAMGADSKISIRFSFGRWTKKRDIAKAAKIIVGILHQR
jgi:cysteine sulfinate desulfinase/cysteine desulfurase-like protein